MSEHVNPQIATLRAALSESKTRTDELVGRLMAVQETLPDKWRNRHADRQLTAAIKLAQAHSAMLGVEIASPSGRKSGRLLRLSKTVAAIGVGAISVLAGLDPAIEQAQEFLDWAQAELPDAFAEAQSDIDDTPQDWSDRDPEDMTDEELQREIGLTVDYEPDPEQLEERRHEDRAYELYRESLIEEFTNRENARRAEDDAAELRFERNR